MLGESVEVEVAREVRVRRRLRSRVCVSGPFMVDTINGCSGVRIGMRACSHWICGHGASATCAIRATPHRSMDTVQSIRVEVVISRQVHV